VLDGIQKVILETGVQTVFADVQFVSKNNPNRVVRYYSSAGFDPRKFKYGFMPAHPSFFTSKSNYEKHGLYKIDYRIAADYELLMRFLYTQKVPFHYWDKSIVAMRLGGVSTRSPKSTYIINKEIVRACRENGVRTNLLLLSLRYFVKIRELMVKEHA
jgi:hypothetical protein